MSEKKIDTQTAMSDAIQTAMRDAIQAIAVGPDRGRDISSEHAQQIMSAILEGETDDVQTAVFLIALRMKRESEDEFFGLFSGLQASIQPQIAEIDELICIADPFDGYVRTLTMTPFIAPVLAACHRNVLIHGVMSVGPKHGVTAHKVYKMAGMNTLASQQEACRQLVLNGCAYLDQRIYAPAVFALQGLRDQIVKRTALTTLERLLVPVRARHKTHAVLGYVHKAYPQIYARVAELAGYDQILLLKGVEGGLAPALNKPLRRFQCPLPMTGSADDMKEVLPLPTSLSNKVAGQAVPDSGDPVGACLQHGVDVLSGKRGTARDSLVFAAGHILAAHQPTFDLSQAVEKVEHCLDNGSAKAHFNQMIANAD